MEDDGGIVEFLSESLYVNIPKRLGTLLPKKRKQKKILNFLIAFAAGGFVVSTIFATVVFDIATVSKATPVQEIEWAAMADPTEGHSYAWMNAIIPLYITMDMVNISKVTKDGRYIPGSIIDLFPSNGPVQGSGRIRFRMKRIGTNDLPNLAEMNQKLVPLAHLRKESAPDYVLSFLKMVAMFLKWWKFLYWLGISGSFTSVMAGTVLIIIVKTKTLKTEAIAAAKNAARK